MARPGEIGCYDAVPMRSFFLISCALMLILLFGVWLRSRHFADGVEISKGSQSVLLTDTPGSIQVWWPSPTYWPPDRQRWRVCASSQRFSSPPTAGVTIANSWVRGIFDTQITTTYFSIGPTICRFTGFALWPFALFASLPLLITISRRSWRSGNRHLRNHCLACGYDLRATPERCPECGRIAVPFRFSTLASKSWLWLGMFAALTIAARFAGVHDFRNPNPRPLAIRQISEFPFDDEHGTDAQIPSVIQGLDGQRLSIEGFMIPMDQTDAMTEFALVPNLIGERSVPKLTETIVVRSITSNVISYYPGRLCVTGTLHVRVVRDQEYVVAIYAMDADSVEPADK